jgi:hypothetical protein
VTVEKRDRQSHLSSVSVLFLRFVKGTLSYRETESMGESRRQRQLCQNSGYGMVTD